LTDANGNFIIGDLPPGEHILLLDEKTLPEQTRSVAGSQDVRVAAGNETVILFPVEPIPDQIKKFPRPDGRSAVGAAEGSQGLAPQARQMVARG
jgi:hypothetical protein